FEIYLFNVRLIYVLCDADEVWNKGMLLLGPQCIGHIELQPLVCGCFLELALEVAKNAVELRLGLREVENLGHLFFRVPAGTGIGHRQAGRNTVRREEKVTSYSLELGIKIQGERRVAFHDRRNLSRTSFARQAHAPSNHN